MKIAVLVAASALALGSSVALAQTGMSDAGSEAPRTGVTAKDRAAGDRTMTTGRTRNSGDAVSTGSNVPYDKPNLSNSPESSDSSQKVK